MPLSKDDPRPAAVYRWFAFTGELLYVGCSLDPDKRWAETQATEEWPRLAARRSIEWYESVGEALQAEADAIRSEGPFFNIVKVKKREVLVRWLDLPEGMAPCLRASSRWLVGADSIRCWVSERPRNWGPTPTVATAIAILRDLDATGRPAA